ncbi:3-phosphoshikimate 1-carboxyvinyltransferase [Flavobacterium silvisoli]|uniref:3-phosphoshikimate 1-carboxyvinyltransferase n=1 Tax=Flavobacterium silvisoli TaxID=2529433 RepID=A0A4Q9Z2W5_9FLAO|nr:3-phosphoshikimate 1-carboxyvinyltransferase [Flavobacterium silvisoli]TBX70550.1 3-phosphoshikimate 1-carboxyvinyltransferase [Flavobacterium silvisoli]
MDLLLAASKINQQSKVSISGSKSETNRLLLLQALYPNLVLENTSNSDDSEVMAMALSNNQQPTTNNQIIDISHAGTAMRFLTAYFAIQEGKEVVLTGSARMQERPIQILVDALRQLGAEIVYEKKEGFPPLRIRGKKLTENKVSLSANVSSQYISALLLIAPKLENGLALTLQGPITSLPYIKMTLALLNEMGVQTSFVENKILIKPTTNNQQPTTIRVESDWSSASYFYSIVALSEIGAEITLSSYKKNSLQGDSVLAEIYKTFGVETHFQNNSIVLQKVANHPPSTIHHQLNHSPDIAQTLAVTCFGLGIGCQLTGLHTLKIKETDRLEALKNELMKLGASVSVTHDSISIAPSAKINDGIAIDTYQDHRMAMAFAPLALKTNIIIKEAEVVSKSYPSFWEDLKSIGFQITEQP